jgi:hypothetical protein
MEAVGGASRTPGRLSRSTGRLSRSTGRLSRSTGRLSRSTGRLSRSAGRLSRSTRAFYSSAVGGSTVGGSRPSSIAETERPVPGRESQADHDGARSLDEGQVDAAFRRDAAEHRGPLRLRARPGLRSLGDHNRTRPAPLHGVARDRCLGGQQIELGQFRRCALQLLLDLLGVSGNREFTIGDADLDLQRLGQSDQLRPVLLGGGHGL